MKTLLVILCFVLGSFGVTLAQEAQDTAKAEGNTETEAVATEEAEQEGKNGTEGEEKAEKFNAGKMILEHVGDSHQWHLWGDHGHAAHLSLPVILKTDKGWEFFSSSNLESHEHFYRGKYYAYVLQNEHIEIINEEDHSVNKEATAKVTDLSITKNVAALFFSIAVILVIFLGMAKKYKNNVGKAPKGIQSVFEPFIIFIRDEVAKPSIVNPNKEK